MNQRRLCRLAMLLFLAICPLASGDDAKAATNADLAAAERFYNSGNFAEAADRYQAALKLDPTLVAAQAGWVRALLREDKAGDAFAAANRALAVNPNAAPLYAVMGDVHFRRGEMQEAEISYRKAISIDSQQAQAYLGLARLYRAYSLYLHAYEALRLAYQIAPNDPEVQRMWFRQLSRKAEIAAIEAYLAGPHPDTPEETTALQQRLQFLKATVDQPVHACRLVNKVEQTDTKLELMRRDPTHIFGVGFVAKLNGHDTRLQLDTGAGGMVIGRKAADKAGLTRISAVSYAGIGDKGMQSGYLAVADHIRVGGLEFADCVVQVADRASVSDEDGLIGANVFASYLIDIDLPGQKLRLSPLPKRPDETAAPQPGLNSQSQSGDNPEEKADAPEDQPPSATSQRAAVNANATSPKHLPHDRYVAPEMARWTPVFRFGPSLLIPTHVNDSPALLFVIDTGAMVNVISRQAASEVTKVRDEPYTTVKGLNGSVSNVYRADKATIRFGHLAQKNQDMLSFDLSGISRRMGTEVSGLLGFDTLHMLQIKIDYRDGLVDFVYDASRWGNGR